MNRRRFLGRAFVIGAGVALAPETLWNPTRRVYFDLGARQALVFENVGWADAGVAAGILRKGDVFTIEGEFTCSPTTGLYVPQRFVVTADVTADR